MLCFFSKASWVLERQQCWTTSSRTLRFAVQDSKPLKDVTARNKRRRRSQLLRTSLVRLDVNSFFPLGTTLGNKGSSNQMYTVTYLVVRFQLMMHCWCKRNWPWQRRQRLQSSLATSWIALPSTKLQKCLMASFASSTVVAWHCWSAIVADRGDGQWLHVLYHSGWPTWWVRQSPHCCEPSTLCATLILSNGLFCLCSLCGLRSIDGSQKACKPTISAASILTYFSR